MSLVLLVLCYVALPGWAATIALLLGAGVVGALFTGFGVLAVICLTLLWMGTA